MPAAFAASGLLAACFALCCSPIFEASRWPGLHSGSRDTLAVDVMSDVSPDEARGSQWTSQLRQQWAHHVFAAYTTECLDDAHADLKLCSDEAREDLAQALSVCMAKYRCLPARVEEYLVQAVAALAEDGRFARARELINTLDRRGPWQLLEDGAGEAAYFSGISSYRAACPRRRAKSVAQRDFEDAYWGLVSQSAPALSRRARQYMENALLFAAHIMHRTAGAGQHRICETAAPMVRGWSAELNRTGAAAFERAHRVDMLRLETVGVYLRGCTEALPSAYPPVVKAIGEFIRGSEPFDLWARYLAAKIGNAARLDPTWCDTEGGASLAKELGQDLREAGAWGSLRRRLPDTFIAFAVGDYLDACQDTPAAVLRLAEGAAGSEALTQVGASYLRYSVMHVRSDADCSQVPRSVDASLAELRASGPDAFDRKHRCKALLDRFVAACDRDAAVVAEATLLVRQLLDAKPGDLVWSYIWALMVRDTGGPRCRRWPVHVRAVLFELQAWGRKAFETGIQVDLRVAEMIADYTSLCAGADGAERFGEAVGALSLRGSADLPARLGRELGESIDRGGCSAALALAQGPWRDLDASLAEGCPGMDRARRDRGGWVDGLTRLYPEACSQALVFALSAAEGRPSTVGAPEVMRPTAVSSMRRHCPRRGPGSVFEAFEVLDDLTERHGIDSKTRSNVELSLRWRLKRGECHDAAAFVRRAVSDVLPEQVRSTSQRGGLT